MAFLILCIMKYSLYLLISILALGTLTSCGSDADQLDLVELDLMSQGMPVIILAPEDPVVETKKLGAYQVASIKKGDDYYVEIFESDAVSRNAADIKSRLLSDVQSNQYFTKIMSEDDNGFIYEIAVDSNYINYGFRYLKLQGDKEYIYQNGIGKRFTQDQVEQMYKAVSAVD